MLSQLQVARVQLGVIPARFGDARLQIIWDDGADGAADLYLGGAFQNAGGLGSSAIAQWHGCAGAFESFCAGDGALAPCPCGNAGAAGNGCDNSAATGGARLAAAGTIAPDTLTLTSSGELATALSIFLQGDAELGAPAAFGDGLRCAGGSLRRLYAKNASGGVVSAPAAGEPSVSARSASLGDPLSPGDVRFYQVCYRDPDLAFCAPPSGDAWNVSNGVRVTW